MAEHCDADVDTSMRHDRLSFGVSAGPRLLTGAAIGAALGAFAAYCLRKVSEEPPIRVKGGSTEFEILSGTVTWEQEGSRRNWRLSLGEKRTDDYLVKIEVEKNGVTTVNCYRGDVVRVYHDEHEWVELKARGRQTKLKSPQRDVERRKGRDEIVVHPRDIYKIQVGNSVPYFAADAKLIGMVVCDA